MTSRQELSSVIIAVSELRDKSSYKKTYDSVLKTLKRKLARAKYEGRIVDNVPQQGTIVIQSTPDAP